MITKPEYLEESKKLEKKKNKTPFVASKSKKEATFKTNQQRERNKKKKNFPLHHLQKNVKQINLI